MKYSMFIGEMLTDRTRRATLKDIQPRTDVELMTILREAMGEPTSELGQKYVVLWVDPLAMHESSILSDAGLDFVRQRVVPPFLRRFEDKGFQVACVLRGQNLVFIEARTRVVERDVFVCNKAASPQKEGQRWSWPQATDSFNEEFMQAAWGAFLATGDFGVSWAGKTEDAGTAPRKLSEPERISIGLGAYLRAMWTLLWTAFRHPFTTTVVDLTTGKRLAELSIPFHEWEASLSSTKRSL